MPPAGSALSCTENTMRSTIASQNTGVEMPRNAVPAMMRSNAVLRRVAHATPSGIAAASDRPSAMPVSSSVFGRRVASRRPTDSTVL